MNVFENFEQVDVSTVDIEDLVDISTINIDTNLPKEKRIEEFIKLVKNPYCFRVGKVAVSIKFADDGANFEQKMEQYLQTL